MAAGDEERAYWARVWAKANRDDAFKAKLETDPVLAYRQIQAEIGPMPNPGHPMIADLIVYEGDIGEKISKKTVPELEAIIVGDEVVKILPNELKKKV